MRISWRDLFAVLILLLLVACVFYKTVFLGVPVSKIAILAHWDSFFYDQARGQNMSLDPTTLLLYVPMYFLVGNIWRSGVFPLWNPLSGCGSPLVGDIELNIFSPWKLLFALYPCLKTYNYILIGEVACAGLASYVLARLLRLSPLPSIYAAVTFCFCPFILNFFELTTGPVACFLPIVFIAFVLLARCVSALTVFCAAIACSLLIFSEHPESSFFGIMSGVLLAFCLRLFGFFDSDSSKSLPKSLLKFGCGITATALLTFAFCAPVLLPFAEYLRNSECYKFLAPVSGCNWGCTSWKPVLTLVSYLAAASFAGASPYLGAVLLPALSIGPFKQSRLWRALTLLCLALILVVTQIGPVGVLFSHGPLATIGTRYALPALLLSLSLLGAYGVQCLCQVEGLAARTLSYRTMIFTAIFVCVLQIVLAVFIRAHEHGLTELQFDNDFPLIISRQSLQTVILCSIAFAVIVISKRLRQMPSVMTCFVIAISWLSVAPTFALSLPTHEQFVYRLKEPLLGLNLINERLLSLGESLLRPDTNWIFGISDLRCEKSLFPRRYPEYMVACGARVDSHTQIFDGVPGPAFDFAAVPYVLSQSPVIDEQDELGAHKAAISPNPEVNNTMQFVAKAVSADLTLENAQFNYLPDDFALTGDLTWRYLGDNKPPLYLLKLALSSADGKLFWSTDYPTLNQYPPQLNVGGYGPKQSNTSSTDSIIRRHVSMFIPTSIPPGSKVRLSMSVFDTHATRWTPAIYSADFDILAPSSVNTKKHFALIKESAYSNGDIFRLYRNNNAVPQAYLVHNVIQTNSADESLALISKPNFNAHTTAVIESNSVPLGISVSHADQDVISSPTLQEREDVVSLRRPDMNCAAIKVSTTRPGLLVLSDTFYPGWHAYVDGKNTSIVRCNYLFKGIYVSEGNHNIEFRYQPDTFIVGAIMALAAALLSAAALRFVRYTG